MERIEIYPLTSNVLEIRFPDGNRIEIPNVDGPETMAMLKEQAPGQVRVYTTGEGFGYFHLDRDNENKALELTTLDGFEAAKQVSKGYIDF